MQAKESIVDKECDVDWYRDNLSPFQKLGLEPDCTLAEINTSYKLLAMIHNPASGGNQDMFDALNKAYNILKRMKDYRPSSPAASVPDNANAAAAGPNPHPRAAQASEKVYDQSSPMQLPNVLIINMTKQKPSAPSMFKRKVGNSYKIGLYGSYGDIKSEFFDHNFLSTYSRSFKDKVIEEDTFQFQFSTSLSSSQRLHLSHVIKFDAGLFFGKAWGNLDSALPTAEEFPRKVFDLHYSMNDNNQLVVEFQERGQPRMVNHGAMVPIVIDPAADDEQAITSIMKFAKAQIDLVKSPKLEAAAEKLAIESEEGTPKKGKDSGCSLM